MKEKSSVHRIQESSFANDDMARLAIRGEMNWGQYLRDTGVGAASGAATGAFIGGVGAIPGAIGGAAFGLGSNLVTDIAYQMYGNDGKAAWQAGDLQERIEKMGDWLASKNKDAGNSLKMFGAQYKNYIDVAIRKKDDDESQKTYKENMFNPNTQKYKDYVKFLTTAQTKNNKFVRVAQDNGTTGLVGGVGSSMVADMAMKNTLPPAQQGITKSLLNPKNLMQGAKGLGAGMAVDFGLNWALDAIDRKITGDEAAMFRRELEDVRKIITEINRLTENDPNVVYAGNMLWTALDRANRLVFQAAEQQAQQQAQQQASQNASNTPNNPVNM